MALFPRDQGLLKRDLSLVKFGFRWHFFNLNTALYFLVKYVCMEENNLKISLALYMRLEFRILECIMSSYNGELTFRELYSRIIIEPRHEKP